MKSMKRLKLLLLLAIVAGLMLRSFLLPSPGTASERPMATSASMDLYGASVGFTLQRGDTVSVRSASGVVCGSCDVTTSGFYGLLHVYADDPATQLREGASTGEQLYLEVNGRPVKTVGTAPVWTRDGDRQKVNISK
jgi:hypothetical protein